MHTCITFCQRKKHACHSSEESRVFPKTTSQVPNMQLSCSCSKVAWKQGSLPQENATEMSTWATKNTNYWVSETSCLNFWFHTGCHQSPLWKFVLWQGWHNLWKFSELAKTHALLLHYPEKAGSSSDWFLNVSDCDAASSKLAKKLGTLWFLLTPGKTAVCSRRLPTRQGLRAIRKITCVVFVHVHPEMCNTKGELTKLTSETALIQEHLDGS